jgi:phosphatidylserine/phosphatidylglycerophosphate/cardiolipin synthase-like enzyme
VQKISGLLIAALLAACAAAPALERPSVVEVTSTDAIQVFFSDPSAADAQFVEGGPDEELAAAIDAARLSVEVAIHNLNLYSVRDALLAAQERGVDVRMVVEGDNFGSQELHPYLAAGIPVVLDGDRGTMHNKFVVIDRYEVWTGSVNFTVGDMYYSRNNLLRLRSGELAENYLHEFEEMFINGEFSDGSHADTLHPEIGISGVEIENYFSPDDGTLGYLVDLVNDADESVYFLAFSLTSDPLAEALVAAQQRGVEVRGVMDESQVASNQGGDYEFLRAAGVDVRQDGEGGNLHHKVLIIDGEMVVTGSYNFSRNAEERNDENTLVIYSEDIAAQFLHEFLQLWELGF